MLGPLGSPTFAIVLVSYVQSRSNTAGVTPTGPFDGERVFADLNTLVSFGPRPSGSEALRRTREFIIAELRAAGVGEDEFIATTPVPGEFSVF